MWPGLLFDEADVGFFVKDAQGTILYANAPFRTKFANGIDVVGKSSDEVLTAPLRELAGTSDRQVFGRKQPLSFVVSLPRNNGTAQKWFHIAKVPILAESSSCLGLLAMASEISESTAGQLDSAAALGLSPFLSSNAVALRAKHAMMSARELQIMQMISIGYLNKQLAGEFDVSVRTIENWRQQIMNKLEVDSPAELVRYAVRMEDLGLIPYLDEKGETP